MTNITTLSNGVTLLLEPVDSVRSASIGIWANVGSRHETAAQNGICHCLEHMVFKGTTRYSATRLAALTDSVGGQFNAYTTKDATAYYARVLHNHLATAQDILTDMVFHANLRDKDLSLERSVILEEIDMYEDSPEDLVGETLLQAVFPGQALGRPILGSPETLQTLTGKDLQTMRDQAYRGSNLIAAIVGQYNDTDIKNFADVLSTIPASEAVQTQKASYISAVIATDKPLEQNHLCLTFPCLPAGHGRRYIKHLLCGILGGGWSSRLYQALRETHGLCYNVYCNTTSFIDTGLLSVYTALGHDTEDKALRMIGEILASLAHDGPTQDELDRHRESVKASVVIGLESTGSRISHAVHSMKVLGHVATTDEIITGYDAVTVEQIRQLAAETLRQPSFSAVGQVKHTDAYRNLIEKALCLSC
ncbi:MAG: insulinase family protein [Oscillospiraceae bacterium]|nr:insulinase family protein [Oscillospiraceae bacterium]